MKTEILIIIYGLSIFIIGFINQLAFFTDQKNIVYLTAVIGLPIAIFLVVYLICREFKSKEMKNHD